MTSDFVNFLIISKVQPPPDSTTGTSQSGISQCSTVPSLTGGQIPRPRINNFNAQAIQEASPNRRHDCWEIVGESLSI
jgi:hypothetical protein